jgi:aconitate hydratase
MDEKTIDYLRLTGRSEKQLAIIESYGKANFMWRDASADDKLIFTKVVELDLSDVIPSLAGPKRPQDRVDINKVSQNFKDHVKNATVADKNILGDGSVVIAAITSCTNTSNPSVMIAAGLLAKKAVERGLKVPSFVKTSLAPGSQVVSEYLQISGLQQYLDALGFNTVGYGCTTCIGNSGPLIPEVEKNIKENNISVASVLSGNRNFENRVHALVGANYLASPPLVVAFALLGNVLLDINAQPLGIDVNGKEVFLRDIWPSHDDVSGVISAVISDKIYKKRYADVYKGDAFWQNLQVAVGSNFAWKKGSTYVENPPYFTAEKNDLGDIKSAHILAILGDSVTTDHISPAGAIADNSPAALYLKENGVQKNDFNSYGSRRGSHSVMMRGTFSNAKIKNNIADVPSGALSKYVPTGEIGTIFDVAMRYIEAKQPTVIIAGKEYGTGSSRDWAAKGTNLLGVKAVIAESFERIHRSNLVGMGVMPLQFINITVSDLKLCGSEQISIFNLDKITPNCTVDCKISYADGAEKVVQLKCLIKTQNELLYYRSGGVMQFVAAKLN